MTKGRPKATYRVCKRCGQNLHIAAFGKSPNGTKYHALCRKCQPVKVVPVILCRICQCPIMDSHTKATMHTECFAAQFRQMVQEKEVPTAEPPVQQQTCPKYHDDYGARPNVTYGRDAVIATVVCGACSRKLPPHQTRCRCGWEESNNAHTL